MSTVPPSSMQATVPGFTDATPYDPLLGEDMSEEQLAHIHSHNHTPNPKESFASPPPQDMSHARNSVANGAHAGREDDLFDFSNYNSRVDSGLSNKSLGLSFDPEIAPPFNDHAFVTAAQAADQTLASPVDPPSRKSSGLATMSEHSQLMSPTLTNSTMEPNSPRVVEAKNAPYRQLGGGDMSRNSSLSTVNPTSHPHLQSTPAPTRSSAVTSPDPHADARMNSPVVRVEAVNHHDPPAQVIYVPQTTAKRSIDQAQPNLLYPEYGTSGQDDDMTYLSDQAEDGSQLGRPPVPRLGLSPAARADAGDAIPSINELAVKRDVGERNNQVASWLLNADAGPGTYLDPNAAIAGAVRGRLRSKSQSKNSQQLQADAWHSMRGRRVARDRSTPGPDVLIDEDSGDDDDDDDDDDDVDDGDRSQPESAPASVDGKDATEEKEAHNTFGHLDVDERPMEAFPWADSIVLPSRPGERSQPATSQAAIMRFQMRNMDRDMDTASRAATWGTRRMSDSTLDQVFGSKGLFSRLRITSSRESRDKESEDGHEIRSSLQEGIDHMRQKYKIFRANSVNKRKSSEPIKPRPLQRTETYKRGVSPHSQAPSPAPEPSGSPSHERKESTSSFSNLISRGPSIRRSGNTRPTTPRITTGSPEPIKTHGFDHGSSGPSSPSTSSHGTGTGILARFRESFNRHSRSDENGNGGIFAQMYEEGGPPVPALTSPRPDESKQLGEKPQAGSGENEDEDEDDDDAATARPDEKPEKGVKMPMSPRKDLIIPNFDGFKSNVRDVNPRLDQWLVERLGQEQLRRYKRLVEIKVNHVKAIQQGTCSSGDFCAAKGGQPRYFAPPKSHKDSVGSADADVPLDEMDEDEQAIAEGTVTEAQFPQGLPMPPVQRLPAEFECPFCFQVKKFTKPSDWSKHVHEDLQPFTCTFKNCSDPKSFKRKADWVRHENERHRQLEWWECREEGCQHRCYRRDNFVQHLIREHKLPEPATKPTKPPNKPAVRGPAKGKGRGRGNTANINDVPPEERVLLMVEICRHETTKSAVEERCRFCNNVCNSWKKLTVHLARHMEQLSIPVLELVKEREVNIDTIISPVEPIQSSVSPIEQQPQQQQLHQQQTGAHTFPPPMGYPTASSNTAMANTMAMDERTFVQLSNFGVGSNIDAASMFQWLPQQQQQQAHATQLQFGPGVSTTPYSDLQQEAYGPGSQGMYMQDAAGQAQALYPESMAEQSHYDQASEWQRMQTGMQAAYTQSQPVGYPSTQQRRQQQNQHQQQNLEQFYGGHWQQ